MVAPAPLMRSRTFVIIYRIVLFIFIMFLLPFVTLAVVNYKIIVALKLSSRLRRLMIPGPPRRDKQTTLTLRSNEDFVCKFITSRKSSTKEASDRHEEGITVMLVAIVTEFLLFNFLAFANNVLELIFESFASSKYFQLLVEVSTLLVNLNGATTIIIYLIFGSKYRNVFRKIVGRAFNSLTRRQKSWKSKEDCQANEVTVLIMSNGDGIVKKRTMPRANSSVTLVNSNAFTQNGTFVLLNHDEAAMI
uniref:G-protein coupled receptors family 1 profile domain-containing protein n=1 Tax=Parascaris univalens TaxID=6257 RepID=A0A915CC98_PARUN